MKEKTEYEIIDCVNVFENYYNNIDISFKEYYSKNDLKWDWFTENIIGVTFYDTDLSIKWGKLLYKTVKAILERLQSIIMSEMYEEYLVCLNLIGTDKLDWGSSIRYCWFNEEEKEYIDKLKDAIKQVEVDYEREKS